MAEKRHKKAKFNTGNSSQTGTKEENKRLELSVPQMAAQATINNNKTNTKTMHIKSQRVYTKHWKQTPEK